MLYLCFIKRNINNIGIMKQVEERYISLLTDFGFDLTEEILDINEFFSPVDKPKDEESPHTVTCPFCGAEFTP